MLSGSLGVIVCMPLAQYRTAAFLAKNRDFVVGEHQALLQASEDPFIAALFPAEPEANGNAPVRKKIHLSKRPGKSRKYDVLYELCHACHCAAGMRSLSALSFELARMKALLRPRLKMAWASILGQELARRAGAATRSAQARQLGTWSSERNPIPKRVRCAGGRARRQGGPGLQVQLCGQPVQAPAGRADGGAAPHGAALHPLHQTQLIQPVRP